MVGFKSLAAAALLAAQGVLASLASPALASRGEGIHLFNCYPIGGAGVQQTWLSIVVVSTGRVYVCPEHLLTIRLQYCANDSDCSNLGYSPPSENVCIKSSSTSDSNYHVWEGSSQSCTFPSGVTFSWNWNIQGNAQSQANYAYVGYVSLPSH
jgi:hypothetical protein